MSRVLDHIDSQAWAITEEALSTIRSIVLRHEGEHFDAAAIEQALGRPLRDTRSGTIRDGIAILPLHGPLFRYANVFTEISGATSLEVFSREFGAALENPDVRAILLDVDSPGGQVNGTEETAELIFRSRARKPITALVSGSAASGAYWLATAASRIVTTKTGILGNIGTVMGVDAKGPRDGQIVFVSSQSPRKVPNATKEAGARDIQSLVDSLAQVFINAVARNMGTTPEKVVAEFGQGWVMVGQEAVTAGLAHEVGTLESVIANLSVREAASASRRPAARGTLTTETRAMELNRDYLNQHAPALVAQVLAEGRASAPQLPTIDSTYLSAHHPALVAEIKASGAPESITKERERTAAVFALGWDENGAPRASAKGFEKLVIAGMGDGSSKADVALKLVDAREEKEKNVKAAKLQQLKDDEKDGGSPPASQDADAASVNPQLAALRQGEVLRKGAPAPSTN